MPNSNDNDHVRISDSGELELAGGPRTWDGEPIYCADTVREGLFDASAFAQMPGQMSIEVRPEIGSPIDCPRCGKECRVESHNHAHCSRCFSGFRTDVAPDNSPE